MQQDIRVLLVDDEPFILQGLKMLLDWEAAGYEVHTATNGKEALDFYKLNPVDLIIADIKMIASIPINDAIYLENNNWTLLYPLAIIFLVVPSVKSNVHTSVINSIPMISTPLVIICIAPCIAVVAADGERDFINNDAVYDTTTFSNRDIPKQI